MSIDKKILFQKLREFVLANYHEIDKPLVVELIYKIILTILKRIAILRGGGKTGAGLTEV